MERVHILNGRQTTDDYPYGGLRCTRHTELEYKSGKGYRVAHTTVNPKTGRVNNPKRSTYSTYMAMYRDEDTGHTKVLHFSLNGIEELERFREFLKMHEDVLEFTEKQSQDLWATVISCIKISSKFTKFRRVGESTEALAFIEAVGTRKMIRLYGERASIKELADWESITGILECYEDRKDGKAIIRYKIG